MVWAEWGRHAEKAILWKEEERAVFMESVHRLMRSVASVPSLRPAWFFDVDEQGEALADVGTHLVDLAQWTVFPDQALDTTPT